MYQYMSGRFEIFELVNDKVGVLFQKIQALTIESTQKANLTFGANNI